MFIVTISEMRRNITKIVQQIREQDDYAIITQHGKPVVVMLSYERYNALVEKLANLEDALAPYQ